VRNLPASPLLHACRTYVKVSQSGAKVVHAFPGHASVSLPSPPPALQLSFHLSTLYAICKRPYILFLHPVHLSKGTSPTRNSSGNRMTRTARNSLTSTSPSPLTVRSFTLSSSILVTKTDLVRGRDSVGDILDHVPARLAGGIRTDRHRVI
jgi:hypothetical protein